MQNFILASYELYIIVLGCDCNFSFCNCYCSYESTNILFFLACFVFVLFLSLLFKIFIYAGEIKTKANIVRNIYSVEIYCYYTVNREIY